MLDLDNILRHLSEPPVDGIHMHPVTDAELRALVAELHAAREVVKAVLDPGCVCAPPPQSVQDATAAYLKIAGGGS